MRIIAGEARSRIIKTPVGRDTRPTLDRVRESLFNILQPYTRDAHVLDLFAGSGALAFEALSRGAHSAVLVDVSKEANSVQHLNARALGFKDRARILLCDWKQALEQLSCEKAQFDLVFLDPPYQMPDLSCVAEKLLALSLLNEDALVVVEHDEAKTPLFGEGFLQVDKRRYGKAGIAFYTIAERADEAD